VASCVIGCPAGISQRKKMLRYLYRTWQMRRMMRRRLDAANAQRATLASHNTAAAIDSSPPSTSQPLPTPASPQQSVGSTTETLQRQADAISRFQAQLDASVREQRSSSSCSLSASVSVGLRSLLPAVSA
jgi:hypothetical protein